MSEMFNVFGFGLRKNEDRERIIKESMQQTGQITSRDGQTFYTGAGPKRKGKAEQKVSLAEGGLEGESDMAIRNEMIAGNLSYEQAAQKLGIPVRVGSMSKGYDIRPQPETKDFPREKAPPINPNFVEKILKVPGGTIQKNWEKNGGFEGMMANPAFTLGLAIMQSSAQGKRLDEGLLNNFVKAAGISDVYKQKLKDAGEIVQRPSEADMVDITEYLDDQGYRGPSFIERHYPGKGKQMVRSHRRAKELIAIESKQIAKAMERKGKTVIMDDSIYRKAIANLRKNNKIIFKDNIPLIRKGLTLETEKDIEPAGYKQYGGPITKGKSYVVGEAGPEIVIPNASAKVLSNDDSKVFSMLLNANPQLHNVSKARAEKILRNRFPEYF